MALPLASPLGDLGFFINLIKSGLSQGGGRTGKRENSEPPERLQLSAHSGKGKYGV